ncbi:MAG: NAD(P)-dependent oxidoreductase [Reyranella sp.]|uniref:NAD(P)-dependent oxidoreductase n=1 Tax=Reyranella sp. TaxID=1929291 RepID=UPI003D09CC40
MQKVVFGVISFSLNETTRGLIGTHELGLMKPTAWLVNVARAEIIDGEALYQALAERRIAGAAIDVWYRYPQDQSPTWPASQAFHELPNVLMRPHVAGGSEGTVQARVAVVAENIARLVRGERPIDLVERPS